MTKRLKDDDGYKKAEVLSAGQVTAGPINRYLMCRLREAVLLAMLLAVGGVLSELPARATYRADFFDTTKRPTIAFDKGRLTWTLRNQGVERVVHFDVKTGGLQTLTLRDLKTHHVLQQAPGGEGEISFASPLLETPRLLTGWKYTAADPGSAWKQPEFDDATWKAIHQSPSAGHAEGQPTRTNYWYRAAIPAGRLLPGHAYALYLPHNTLREAEIYADGALIQKIGDGLAAGANAAQIDLPPGCRMLAVHTLGETIPLNAYIVEIGTSPPNLLLTSDWQYMQHTINVGEDNSEILTIRLSGLKQHEGFELDVCYQIHAGEEPTIAKWFSFVSHRKSRFLVESVTFDRWRLPTSWQKEITQKETRQNEAGGSTPLTLSNAQSGDVLLTTTLNVPFESTIAHDNTSAATNAWLYEPIKQEAPLRTPRSITAFWHGGSGTAAFLHQLYLGQYVARGNPNAIPLTYATGFAYRDQINATTCEKIIPLAVALGVQAFVLDDGWQTNSIPDTGRYGDWLTDKSKFPQGLLPISTLVRENKLRFGLWADAARVSPSSQAATLHPDWLYKPLPVENESAAADFGDRMCFTGVWARQLSQSLLSLCREQSVTYLKTSGDFQTDCMAATHEHAIGHSALPQQEAWLAFCDTLRTSDKTFVVTGTGNTAASDAITEQEWLNSIVSAQRKMPFDFWATMIHVSHPTPARQPSQVRPANEDTFFEVPAFAQSGQALCHVPVEGKPSRDQLDYLWSSSAARYANIEVQGDLQQMDADELALARKWITWNLQNREWLAFSQPVTFDAESKGTAAQSGATRRGVSGVLHLRNALKGRYGYLCLWNLDAAETTVTPSFTPADYFVRVKSGMEISNTNDGKPVPFSQHSGDISLGQITLPPYGWTVYEIKAK